MKAVILAGGKGTRLAPYTAVLPKPLMPMGDMPILEVVLRQLKRRGVDRVDIAVGHLAAPHSCAVWRRIQAGPGHSLFDRRHPARHRRPIDADRRAQRDIHRDER